jgi:hypothetical protein
VQNSTAILYIYPRERFGTHCIGGWVGPRAGLNGSGKCRPQRDLITGPPSPYPVVIATELTRPGGPIPILLGQWALSRPPLARGPYPDPPWPVGPIPTPLGQGALSYFFHICSQSLKTNLRQCLRAGHGHFPHVSPTYCAQAICTVIHKVFTRCRLAAILVFRHR